jgi:release factor glutamine methyltransferase
MDHPQLTATLHSAGFLAAGEDAAALLASTGGDPERTDALLRRRLAGEPLPWLTGHTTFCGFDIAIRPGVYVPRRHSEALARRAAARLPARGSAADLCTGSGAIAAVLSTARPEARVVANDVDEGAVACAIANGVEAYRGDLFEGLPAELRGHLDVVVAVVPYVPTRELPFLQRDTFTFETALAYDGGPDGTRLLRRVIRGAASWLRPGGALLVELGGDQADLLAAAFHEYGYTGAAALTDEEGDVRGVEATLGPDVPAGLERANG